MGGHGLAPSKSGYSNHRTLHHIFPLPLPPKYILQPVMWGWGWRRRMELLSIKITVENDFELMRPVSRNIFPHPPKLQNRMVITAPGDKSSPQGGASTQSSFPENFHFPWEGCRRAAGYIGLCFIWLLPQPWRKFMHLNGSYNICPKIAFRCSFF